MKKFGLMIAALLMSNAAFAEEVATAAAASAGGIDKGLLGIGAALTIGLAAFGGAISQAKAAAASLEGTARNPQASGKLFIPMIISLALIESLVIYALIVALQIVGKI